jgi:hypothetical protein
MAISSRARLALCAASRAAITLIALGSSGAVAIAQQPPQASAPAPFSMTLSNSVPLEFGMDASSVAAALGAPLYYVSGRAGDEVLMAIRGGGTGLLPRRDRLYLQFRGGRLTGWKGDWGHNWMWR